MIADNILAAASTDAAAKLFNDTNKTKHPYFSSVKELMDYRNDDKVLPHFLNTVNADMTGHALYWYYTYCCDDVENRTVWYKLSSAGQAYLESKGLLCDNDLRSCLLVFDSIYKVVKLSQDDKRVIFTNLDKPNCVRLNSVHSSVLISDRDFNDILLTMLHSNVGILRCVLEVIKPKSDNILDLFITVTNAEYKNMFLAALAELHVLRPNIQVRTTSVISYSDEITQSRYSLGIHSYIDIIRRLLRERECQR